MLSVIERHLESTLLAVHLTAHAVDGGLKPYGDIDFGGYCGRKLDENDAASIAQ